MENELTKSYGSRFNMAKAIYLRLKYGKIRKKLIMIRNKKIFDYIRSL